MKTRELNQVRQDYRKRCGSDKTAADKACSGFVPLEGRYKPLHRICRRCAQTLHAHKEA